MTLLETVPHSISFIGAGAMAEAILSGWIAMGMVNADQICACDPSEGRRDIFKKLGATVYENAGLVRCSGPHVTCIDAESVSRPKLWM